MKSDNHLPAADDFQESRAGKRSGIGASGAFTSDNRVKSLIFQDW